MSLNKTAGRTPASRYAHLKEEFRATFRSEDNLNFPAVKPSPLIR